MATLPELVTAFAEVDGRDRKTIDHIGRTVREAGYITTGKRGAGATPMSTRDAVNLMIALNGADGAPEACTAIDRFRSLENGTPLFPREIVPGVGEAETFGEALEALLDGVPSLYAHLRSCCQRIYGPKSRQFKRLIDTGMLGAEIKFRRYSGEISIFHHDGGARFTDYIVAFYMNDDQYKSGFYGDCDADRRVEVAIGFKTLKTIWSSLNPDGDASLG